MTFKFVNFTLDSEVWLTHYNIYLKKYNFTSTYYTITKLLIAYTVIYVYTVETVERYLTLSIKHVYDNPLLFII